MRGPHTLLTLQAARGVAALLVVFYHGGRMLALPQYVGDVPLGGAFAFGHAGVDFFFVLSGFIIYFVHRADIGAPHRLGRYLWRRVTRIYPVYWVVTAALVVLRLAGGQALDPGHLIRSLLLVPQAAEPLLGVAWTLQHEMLFYLVFAVAIAARIPGALLFAAWMALTVIVWLAPFSADELVGFLLDPFHLQFLLGIAAARLVLRGGVAFPRAVALAGAAAFVLVGLAENANLVPVAGMPGRLLYGLAAAAVVVGLATAERRGRLRVGRTAAFAGAASYALYLVHTIVIGLTARALAGAGLLRAMPDWAALLVVVAAACAIAAALHRLVERPMLAALQGRSPRRT